MDFSNILPPRPIELLAPARDADTAIEAIKHGADAVYIGASSHGARASAGNSVSEIKRVVDFAHPFGAKVYVTINTIIYPNEIQQVEELICDLYRIKVDALIVQDMALLRMNIPPIALHASTQCEISTPDKARFLAEAGFSQLVLARELSIDETSEIHRTVPDTPLEAFVHGALCVSYSGDCQAGYAVAGRSANRGECPQICRLPFDLIDERGNTLIKGKHLLSLRDLNRSNAIAEMMAAGVSSFKIEGRLKDISYVKNVTAAYRRAIDAVIAANPTLYRRSSFGRSQLSFTPDLNKSFNRGYTEYFTRSTVPTGKMSASDTPKWCGEKVGTVISVTHGGAIKAKLSQQLANGDGLGFFDSQRRFQGFLLNRIDGQMLFPATKQSPEPGATLYRNRDRLRTTALEADTATRTIDATLSLRIIPGGIAIDATDERGCRASVSVEADVQQASTSQSQRRIATLRKSGDTIYRITDITDLPDDIFVPAKVITSLRRNALKALDSAWLATYSFDYRHAEKRDARLWNDTTTLTYHNNVANHLARQFYVEHGASQIEPALESARPAASADRMRVMTTRFCLRRELGACTRTPGAKNLPSKLYLKNGNRRFELKFNCAGCRMHVLTSSSD